MGELIVLPRAEPSSRPVISLDRSAEILFFTGVRYYRMMDEPSAPIVKTRRRRRSATARMETAKVAAEA